MHCKFPSRIIMLCFIFVLGVAFKIMVKFDLVFIQLLQTSLLFKKDIFVDSILVLDSLMTSWSTSGTEYSLASLPFPLTILSPK